MAWEVEECSVLPLKLSSAVYLSVRLLGLRVWGREFSVSGLKWKLVHHPGAYARNLFGGGSDLNRNVSDLARQSIVMGRSFGPDFCAASNSIVSVVWLFLQRSRNNVVSGR